MFRKLIAIIVIVALAVAVIGCKKTPPPARQDQKPTQKAEVKVKAKSPAEYDAQAKKEITPENMQAELDRIEKEVQQDIPGRL
jgi:biopolymer transport protein ExbD